MLQTGINFSKQGFDVTDEALMKLLCEVGFDSFFCGWNPDDNATDALCNLAAKYGMIYESVHAPFGGISHIWKDDEKGAAWVPLLKRVIDSCQRFGIGYATVHVANAPRYNNNGPYGSLYSELGVERFAAVAEYAAERGVKIAIENVEFPQREMLSLTRELEKRGLEQGFATLYDVGHWSCYPCALDFADAFGQHLIGTHVHDNFGCRDPQVITWDDDSHVLPFDGTIDYRKVGNTLKRCAFSGSITLEVSRTRCEDLPWYKAYTLEAFMKTAHERAVHLARLCE
ncbi:MAG: sugar phosphate isomerase/epimerase [Clostridia bacterium]|nr:sugar phosphate isomerase/epimerase [Clostridia bacterium]